MLEAHNYEVDHEAAFEKDPLVVHVVDHEVDRAEVHVVEAFLEQTASSDAASAVVDPLVEKKAGLT